jgi:hypothetical protein
MKDKKVNTAFEITAFIGLIFISLVGIFMILRVIGVIK